MNSASHSSAGRGINRVEYFLDFACPFSAKMYKVLAAKVLPKAASMPDVEMIFRHQVQPWHVQSLILHECSLAVAKVASGKFEKFAEKVRRRRLTTF